MARHRSWTDDDLRHALDGARSWADVKRALGLGPTGNADLLRRRCHELGLSTDHLPRRGEQPRRWTDDELRQAVAEATNLAGVFRRLRLAVGGSAWRRMQEHIRRLQLDTSHWDERSRPRAGGRRGEIAIVPDHLRDAVDGAVSLREVARRLGLNPDSGSVQRRLREAIAELQLPTAHLAGQGWARGRSRPSTRRPLEELLVAGSSVNGPVLRERLVEEGRRDRRCATCGITNWMGEPAPLQLDHINGDPTDNREANLRLLCPNCHAQTPTYCGRNIGNR